MPGVTDAAVVRIETPNGGARLEAHVAVPPGATSPSAEAVRAYAAHHLPDVMVPSLVAVMPQLPLGASGKVDRAGLPVLAHTQAAPARVAASAEETILCEAMASALGIPEVGPKDNFFALGGDSLRAIHVVAQARSHGLDCSVARLYAMPTAFELTQIVREAPASNAAISTLPGDVVLPMVSGVWFPLSSAQSTLLFMSEADPNYEVYVTTLRLSGPFQIRSLQEAVQAVVDRHPFLRLSIDPLGLPEPVQRVLEQARASVDVHDLRGCGELDQTQVLQSFIAAERCKRFDWTQAPQLRVTIHRWTENEFQLTLADPSMDGWCVATVLSEIVTGYGGRMQGAVPAPVLAPANFRAFVELERQTMVDPATHAYWLGVLERAAESIAPADEMQPSARIARRHLMRLPSALRNGLDATARRAGSTLRNVLLAAHTVALWRLRGRSGGLVCVEVTGRLEVPGGDQDLGVYNNIVPLELDFAPVSWLQMVGRVAAAELVMLPHRRFPHARLRTLAGAPLADAVFVHTEFRPYRNLEEGPVRLVNIEATDQTYVPLTAHFTLDPLSDDLGVLIDYDASVYGDSAVTGYAQALHSALTELALRPYSGLVPDLPLISSRKTGSVEWSVVATIGVQARRHPDAIAVEHGQQQLTYRMLDEKSACVAGALVARGLGPEDLVALDLSFGTAMIIGMLGCMKAGAAFVPLDSDAPSDRAQAILASARPALVLRDGGRSEPDAGAPGRLSLAEALAAPPIQPRAQVGDSLAYVLFTSGSTGLPKGVAISWTALSAYLRWAAGAYAFQQGRGAAVVTGADVDMSVTPLFCPLLLGRRVVLAERPGDIEALQRLAADPDLGVLKLAPAHLDALAAAQALPPHTGWPAQLILGGEDIASRHLEMLTGAPCSVVNEYGPTETTVGCMAAWLPDGERQPGCVTLGRPTAGAHIRLVDALGSEPPTGIPGQITVSGPQVARGYLDDPQRTANAFRPAGGGQREYYTGDYAVLDQTGQLRYMGRADRQAKIRGRRVELGDVESKIREFRGVAAAVCLPVRLADGRVVLGACVAARSMAVEPVALRAALAARLPGPLVPARIVVIDAMPITAAGKLDHRRLQQLLATAPEQSWMAPLVNEVLAMSEADVEVLLRQRAKAESMNEY